LRIRKASLIFPGLIFLISLIFYLSYFNYFKINRVETLLLTGASEVLSGKIPYVDFYSYPPGRYWLLAFVYWLFGGPHWYLERLMCLILRSVVNVSTYSIAKRLMPLPFSLIPTLLAIVLPGAFHKVFFSLFTVLNLLLIFNYLQRPSRKSVFFVGLLAGLTMWFRQDVSGFVIITSALLIFTKNIRSDKNMNSGERGIKTLRRLSQGYVPFMLGIGITLLPLISYYALNSNLGELLNGLVIENIEKPLAISKAFSSPLLLFHWPPDTGIIFHYAPILLYLVIGTVLLSRIKSKRRNNIQKNWFIFATLLLGVLTFNQALHWPGLFRLLQCSIPVYILGGFFAYMVYDHTGRQLKLKTGSNTIMLIGRVIIFSAVLLYPIFFSLYFIPKGSPLIGTVGVVKGKHVRIKYVLGNLCPLESYSIGMNQLFSCIERNTKPGDVVLTHLSLWSPAEYLLAKENNSLGLRIISPAPLHLMKISEKERFTKIMSRIDLDSPELLILEKKFLDEYFPRLDKFDYKNVFEDYSYEGSIGFEWVRKSEEGRARAYIFKIKTNKEL
jgi:hypothetical protein